MKDLKTLLKEREDLQKAFENKTSGMSVNQYCSYYTELSKRIKKLSV